jgi:glutamate-1-semialdehyde 2,1-aminomutase
LAKGLIDAAAAANVPVSIGACGAMMTLFFSPDPVVDWNSASRCDTQRYARYFWGLIQRGIYMPCSQFEAFFLSTAHTDSDIDSTIAAAKEVFAQKRPL